MVVGTRPEAIKMAPVVRALRARSDEVETRLVLSGQHTDMARQALRAFDLEADDDLAIMREGQDLYHVVGRTLEGLRDRVRAHGADALLVQGDTATVFVGALVGHFERVRVGHVEAGLRSHDKWAPFPEEMFRRLTDVLSDWYFAPTPRSARALAAEGIRGEAVHVTGNPVVDALQAVDPGARGPDAEGLAEILDAAGPLALLTAHRRESFGRPLRNLFGAVRALVDREPDLRVVYPVHPNPNVREPAQELLGGHPRIHLLPPLDYLDLMAVLARSRLVLTDSGGIQEEAPTFGVPVLVLREVTERPEGVDAGVAELVGTDPGRIVGAALAALARPAGEAVPNPYGDGRAGERIADIVVADLTGAERRTADWPGLEAPGGGAGDGGAGEGAR